MDITKLKKIIDLVVKHEITEFETHEGNDSVRIVFNRAIDKNSNPIAEVATAPLLTQHTSTATRTAHLNNLTVGSVTEEHNNEQIIGRIVKAPMIGTVYLSASPDAANFVEIGQQVKVGDTLCLIEAMKIYNKIVADKNGTIKARYIENAQPVEYEQPLFEIQ